MATFNKDQLDTSVQTSLGLADSALQDITGEPLSDLSDTTITSIASGELLKWNGSAWINNTLAEAGIAAASHTHTKSDLTDVADFLLESEVDTDIKTLVLPASTTITSFAQTFLDDTTQGAVQTTLGVDPAGTDNSTDVTLAGTGTYLSLAGQQITVDPITESDISDLQSYLLNVVEDTTPQLGGNLDVNGNAIAGASSSTDVDLKVHTGTFAWADTGRIKVGGLLDFNDIAPTSGQPGDIIQYSASITANSQAQISLIGFNFKPSVSRDTAQSISLSPAFYANNSDNITAGGLADSVFGFKGGFASGQYHFLNHSGAAGSSVNVWGFGHWVTLNRQSGTGTHTVTNLDGYHAFAPQLFFTHVGAGFTVTTARGLYMRNPSTGGGGAITTNVGVDIDDLTTATTNLSLRSAGSSVEMRHAGPGAFGKNATPNAQFDIDQSSSSGAIPVLELDQGDIDDTFINFVGTSAADGTRSISTDTTEDSAKYGAIRVEINGTTKWIRIYDDES